MIPLRVSGCAVQDCRAGLAAVAEAIVMTASDGHNVRIDIPICEAHAEAWRSTSTHAPATLIPGLVGIRRVIVVEPRLLVEGEPYEPGGRQRPDADEVRLRRRWPSYQELLHSLVDRRHEAAMGQIEKPRGL